MIIYFKILWREPRLHEIPRGAWAEWSYALPNRTAAGWMLCSAVEQFFGAGSGYFRRRV